MIDLTVNDGKYRYVFDKQGARAYRHGELWRDCCGDKFILALAQEIEDLREQMRLPGRLGPITDQMIDAACEVCIGFSGDYGEYNDHLDEPAAREVLEAVFAIAKDPQPN